MTIHCALPATAQERRACARALGTDAVRTCREPDSRSRAPTVSKGGPDSPGDGIIGGSTPAWISLPSSVMRTAVPVAALRSWIETRTRDESCALTATVAPEHTRTVIAQSATDTVRCSTLRALTYLGGDASVERQPEQA